LIHRKEAHYKGERVPEEDSYYKDIAMDLVGADAIILIGHGTGKSSAAEFLTEYLKVHHPDEFRRIIKTETAELSALTEPQIEELARKHANLARPSDTKTSI
jgi:stalled ribosome rescue protein Dom34